MRDGGCSLLQTNDCVSGRTLLSFVPRPEALGTGLSGFTLYVTGASVRSPESLSTGGQRSSPLAPSRPSEAILALLAFFLRDQPIFLFSFRLKATP
jgi:hypothetical protein